MSYIDPRLKHLSQEQVKELMRRYYDPDKVERVADLAAEYRVDVPRSGLVALFPPIVRNDISCPYCRDIPLLQKRVSRGRNADNPQCPECGHVHGKRCHCVGCTKKAALIKQESDARKRRVLEAQYSNNGHALAGLSSLSLRDTLYLLALVRHSVDESLRFVDPFGEKNPPFAPTEYLRKQVVMHLYARGLVAPSPLSNPDAFVFDEAITKVTRCYPDKVLWEFLPEADAAAKRDLIESLQQIAQGDQWPEDWMSDRYGVWIEIAKFECIEYYHHQLAQRDFKIEDPGPKTHSVFETLLERLSVAQIFNLIYNAARNAGDRIVRERIPRYQARNNVIGAIQRDAERREANKWEISPYKRDFNCPATALSTTYFDLFLNIGTDAFNRVPYK